MFNVGIELVKELWEGIKSMYEWLKEKLQEFGDWVVNGLKSALGLKSENSSLIKNIGKKTGTEYVEGMGFVKKDAEQAGKDLVNGVTKGINNQQTQNNAFNAVTNLGQKLLAKARAVMQINSPSKATEEMGKFLDLGLQEGIENNAKSVISTAINFSDAVVSGMSGAIDDTNAAMRMLTSGVEASVNPTINPTANSNPLYITIDKFYNNRATDVQQLAQELEFYRKNSALAKGGN